MRRTRSAVSADIGELIEAIEWVSAGADLGNAAYVRRDDGRVFWIGDGIEQVDDVPDDSEDGARYLALPDKRDLGLGKPLALRFAEEHLPSGLAEVRDIFGRRGAYQRFKNLLERQNRLEDWYRFEASAIKDAAAAWAQAHGLEVHGPEQGAADA